MNDDNTLVGRILSWTRLHENSDQIVKWIEATDSTTNAIRKKIIDDLLGETE